MIIHINVSCYAECPFSKSKCRADVNLSVIETLLQLKVLWRAKSFGTWVKWHFMNTFGEMTKSMALTRYFRSNSFSLIMTFKTFFHPCYLRYLKTFYSLQFWRHFKTFKDPWTKYRHEIQWGWMTSWFKKFQSTL